MASLLPEDIQILSEIKNIKDYNQFIDNYEKIERAFQAKMIGSDADYDLIKDLFILKEIIKPETYEKINYFKKKWEGLYRMASGNLKKAFTIDSISAAKKNEKYKDNNDFL